MITDKSVTAPAGAIDPLRLVIMSGTFTIGAAGAITVQDSAKVSGIVVSKTGGQTGRYDLLCYRPFTRLMVFACMQGPTTAAFGNTAANTEGVRNVNPTSTTSNGQIQGILASTGADADFPSGTIMHYEVHGYGK